MSSNAYVLSIATCSLPCSTRPRDRGEQRALRARGDERGADRGVGGLELRAGEVHQPAAGADRLHRARLRVVGVDRVERRVDAVGHERPHLRGNFAETVVDVVVGAQRADVLGVGRAAGADHPRAAQLGELHRGAAHAAAGAGDQHRLARPRGQVLNADVRGDGRDRQRRGTGIPEVRRHAGDLLGRQRDPLGPHPGRRGVAVRVDVVTHGELGDARADRLDDPRAFEARRQRQRERGGPVAVAHHRVPDADAHRPHPDQHLAGARDGVGHLAHRQVVVAAEGVQHVRSHVVRDDRARPRASCGATSSA